MKFIQVKIIQNQLSFVQISILSNYEVIDILMHFDMLRKSCVRVRVPYFFIVNFICKKIPFNFKKVKFRQCFSLWLFQISIIGLAAGGLLSGFNEAPSFVSYNKRSGPNCSRWAATVALRACRIFCSKHGKSKKGILKNQEFAGRKLNWRVCATSWCRWNPSQARVHVTFASMSSRL